MGECRDCRWWDRANGVEKPAGLYGRCGSLHMLSYADAPGGLHAGSTYTPADFGCQDFAPPAAVDWEMVAHQRALALGVLARRLRRIGLDAFAQEAEYAAGMDPVERAIRPPLETK